MSENPFQTLCQTLDKISRSVQNQLSQFIGLNQLHPISSITSKSNGRYPLLANSSHPKTTFDPTPLLPTYVHHKNKSAAPVTKEELGRATWTFLHTLAAQYPDKPTRQQKADVKELVWYPHGILSRMYPCKECADHFKEILRGNPVHAGSQAKFSQWLCHVHNVVNRSLDKPRFPCERVDARWGKLDCEQRACDLLGDTTSIGSEKY